MIWLVLILTFALVACGESKTPTPNTPESNQPGTTIPDDPSTPPTTPSDESSLTIASEMTIYLNDPVKIDYTVTGNLTPVFQSTNPNVVTVAEDGTLTGIALGKAAVSVTLGKIQKVCVITVETYAPAAAGKTEEDLGVLPVGTYTITLADGKNTPVTYNTDPSTIKEGNSAPKTISLTTGGEFDEFTIVYQTNDEDPYYIVWMKDQNLYNLSPSSNGSISAGKEILMYYKKTISSNLAYYNDMANGYKWHIRENENGTYTFYSHINNEICLSYKDGKFVAEKADGATGITSFNLNMKERGTSVFNQYISSEGAITIRLHPKVKTDAKLSDERAQKWANDLNIAYEAFVELTSYRVYDNIVIKAYEQCGHIGYVYTSGNYNVISVQRDFSVKDLKKMVQRDAVAASDWNFCVLHEMGHLFDTQVGWYFESEMTTDFKLAYCLSKGGSAAPSEFPAETFFTYETLMDCYSSQTLGGTLLEKGEYGPYQAAHVMLRIQKEIGWEPFKQMFAWFVETKTMPSKNYDRFFTLIDKVSEFSGKDVRAMFTDTEWQLFCDRYGYTNA